MALILLNFTDLDGDNHSFLTRKSVKSVVYSHNNG